MRKIVFIWLLIFAQCSSFQRGRYFELSLLEKISDISSFTLPPPVITSVPVYVIGANDSIAEVSFARLQEIYKIIYKDSFLRFSDFLYSTLNQMVKLDSKNQKIYLYYSCCFRIDADICKLYTRKGLRGLVEKYCSEREGDFYALHKEKLALQKINSISYYFFLNQYIRVDDDYEADIGFKKLVL